MLSTDDKEVQNYNQVSSRILNNSNMDRAFKLWPKYIVLVEECVKDSYI